MGIIILLSAACLACAGHGRRLHTFSEGLQPQGRASDIVGESSSVAGENRSTTFSAPSAAFQPSRGRHPLTLHGSSSRPQVAAVTVATQPQHVRSTPVKMQKEQEVQMARRLLGADSSTSEKEIQEKAAKLKARYKDDPLRVQKVNNAEALLLGNEFGKENVKEMQRKLASGEVSRRSLLDGGSADKRTVYLREYPSIVREWFAENNKLKLKNIFIKPDPSTAARNIILLGIVQVMGLLSPKTAPRLMFLTLGQAFNCMRSNGDPPVRRDSKGQIGEIRPMNTKAALVSAFIVALTFFGARRGAGYIMNSPYLRAKLIPRILLRSGLDGLFGVLQLTLLTAGLLPAALFIRAQGFLGIPYVK